jgi:hypothetical protein
MSEEELYGFFKKDRIKKQLEIIYFQKHSKSQLIFVHFTKLLHEA